MKEVDGSNPSLELFFFQISKGDVVDVWQKAYAENGDLAEVRIRDSDHFSRSRPPILPISPTISPNSPNIKKLIAK